MKLKIPKKVREFIRRYFELNLDNKKVRCPYYINNKKMRQRMNLRVLSGKGTPEEIERESLIYEKLRGVNFSNMSSDQIRDFMTKRRIGVDCSGFAVHVLDKWLISNGKKHLWKYLSFPKISLYRRIAKFFRPVENISASLLTSDLNTFQIKNLNNLKCGDLIRSRTPKRSKDLETAYHVMVISEIVKKNAKTESFTYVHSTRYYGDQHGVRRGRVEVIDAQAPIYKQNWLDIYKGRNWTLKELESDKDYAGVRRLTNVPLN